MKIPNFCASLQQYYNHLVVAEGKREDKRKSMRGWRSAEGSGEWKKGG